MTQRRAAGYNRRLHACAGPNRTSLRNHPDQCDANQAPFTYPTPVSAPKSASFPYPTRLRAPKSAPFTQSTRLQAPKSAPFTQPTRLHAPKRGVFGKAVYQSLLIYVVYRIRTIELDQIYGV